LHFKSDIKEINGVISCSSVPSNAAIVTMGCFSSKANHPRPRGTLGGRGGDGGHHVFSSHGGDSGHHVFSGHIGVVAIMDLAAMAEVEVAAVLVVEVEVEVEGVDASSLRCQIEPYSLTPSKCCHMLQHPSSPFSKFLISMFAMPKPHAHSAPSPVRQADSQTAPA
jgi:hypothetical protein